MGTILNEQTGERFPLRSHHIFGRDADKVDTCLYQALISRLHASVEWTGQSWRIRDLSTNGTWHNGKSLPRNTPMPLAAGDRLNFGAPGESPWILEDCGPPVSLLKALTPGEDDYELDQFRFIPGELNPQWVVFYSRNEARWMYSTLGDGLQGGHEEKLVHGEVLSHNGRRWRVFLTGENHETQLPAANQHSLDDYEFLFDVTLDEECTRIKLRRDQELLDLGERSHHYLLMHLARVRARDARDGLDKRSQGWISNEDLAHDLGLEQAHLNIMVYRARKQFTDELGDDLDCQHLVERRKGRVRFGPVQCKVFKGEQLTDELPCHPSPAG